MARWGDLVRAAAFRVTGDREDARDAAQEAFLVYATRRPKICSESHLVSWLVRCARHRAVTLLRAREARAAREQRWSPPPR
ncbi:MAG: RNA polymerase sigma factor [Terriglobales bacterium]